MRCAVVDILVKELKKPTASGYTHVLEVTKKVSSPLDAL